MNALKDFPGLKSEEIISELSRIFLDSRSFWNVQLLNILKLSLIN